MIKKILVLILLSFCSISNPSFAISRVPNPHPSVTITQDVSILMDTSEEQPVKRAVQDLVRDWYKVFGKAPKMISSVSEAGVHDVLLVVTCKGPSTKNYRDAKIRAFESHLVTTTKAGAHDAVVMQGADMRGTIYAVYTFSEKILGIPPLWIWTSFKPQAKKQILVPAGTYLYFPPPAVKWRAWFPNDRDLIGPWLGKSPENYDAYFETMLRLKLNTREGYLMDTESWKTPYTAAKEICYARDRGLKISFTHTAPFGAVLANWDKYWKNIRHQKPPELLIKNVAALKEFWTYHIETIKREHLDVIWQLGFRGKGDKPFWRRTYADAMDLPKTDADRAQIITAMLKTQVALLKKVTGEAHPLMKITIYNENSDFLAAGLLQLPDDPGLILNYCAARQDHFPPPDIQSFSATGNQPVGYYMNFQFTGTGSHLAPAEGPWKMEDNFRYVARKIKQPLTFSVVNAGNVREHILELSANAAMMWGFDTYKTDDFLKTYCRTYYGKVSGDEIAGLYRAFYQAYWSPRKSDIQGFDRQYVFQDMRYARGVEQLCALWSHPYLENPFNDKNKGLYGAMATDGRRYNIVPADNQAVNQVQAALNGTAKSATAFRKVAAAAAVIREKLPDNVKIFFDDDLYIQAVFMSELNGVLNNMTRAYLEKEQDKTADSQSRLKDALKGVAALRSVKSKADHDRFKGWYEGEVNFNMKGLQKEITSVLEGM